MKASIHRPTKAHINLAAIVSNVQQVRAALPRRTKAFAVVKANAYGHGVLEVARALTEEVDGFCVSNLDEALELRQAGMEAPILILGIISTAELPLAIQLGLSVTVASLEWLESIDLEEISLKGLQCHLKIDSGMGRIGFREDEELLQAIDFLKAQDAIFEGIFTHFATADEVDTTQFEAQLARFCTVLALLPEEPTYVHVSNSATSIWHTDATFNTVRLGNIIYGMNPSGHALELPYPIRESLSLTSELVHVKSVPADSPIGYGATYKTPTEEIIGTVPIGYADGFVRKLQGFSVLVDGQWCEVVGRVSMDQITIRLPQFYPIGTPVTLIGQDGNLVITVQDWADYLDTINYEVTCLLSDRIPRDYDEE